MLPSPACETLKRSLGGESAVWEDRPYLGEGPGALFKHTLTRTVSVVVSILISVTALGFVVPATEAAAATTDSTTPPLQDNPSTGVTAAPLPTAQINGIAWDQEIVGNTVYVAGEFTSARPAGAALGTSESPRQNLMSYNLTTGVMTSWAPSVNGRIRVIKASPDGTRIYIGGSFTSVNGQSRNRLAAFNTSDGSLVSSFAPNVGSDVFGMAVGNNAVYIGGWFASINGVTRSKLGAVSVSNGATLAWAPVADNTVTSLGLTSAQDRVIVSGSFATINGQTAPSLASLDASTGDLYAFAANTVINNSAMNPTQPGYGAAVTSIRIVNDKVYATGWSYYMGNFEGMVKMDAYSGQIENLMECRGDTYDAVPFKGLIYTVSHHHHCDAIGGFQETSPRWYQHSDAVTDEVTGQVQSNFPGQPSGSYVNWFPTWQPGPANGGSGSQQAGWSTEASGDFLVVGGEFLKVNGIAQQGLVRFGTRNISGSLTSVPAAPGAEMVPSVRNISETATRVTVKSQWDRDNRTLTTDIFRLDKGTTTPVHSFTGESNFWTRPMLSFIDTGMTAGQTYTYRVRFTDPDGNRRWSSDVSIVAGTNVPPSSSYSEQVFADGAENYWRFSDTAGSASVVDWAGGNDATTAAGVTLGAEGAIIGSADTAAGFSGGSTGRAVSGSTVAGPDTFSQELWFKTTTTSGGKLLGLGNAASGNSGSYDRHIYMSNTGRLTFGVYPGAVKTVTSAKAYNDGQWHHVVSTLSENGMTLWVDGMKVGEDPSVTYGQSYTGYWRIGGDTASSWPNAGSSNYFNGTIDDVAIYPTALSKAQVRDHYTKSGRTINVPPTPTDAYGASVVQDDPTLYWRLNEASGNNTAADANGMGVDGTYRTTVTRGVASDVVASDAAAGFNGSDSLVSSNASFVNPTVFSVEAWFQTTTTSGGKIVGFGNSATGTSSSYDRHIYMTSDGKLNFGTYNGATNIITSANSYNDGAWHQVVGSIGANGMQLFVDGILVASGANTQSQSYTGYWRVGGDSTWSGNRYFSGAIDEVALYPRVLDASRVMAHFKASGAWHNLHPTASIEGSCTILGACDLSADVADPDGSIAGVQWDFGDGSDVSTETSVSHTYAAVGTYTITLTATDDLGAQTVVTKTVVVKQQQPAPTDPYGQAVHADDPVLYWRLNESAGTTATDYSTSIHDGTYRGGYTLGADSQVVTGDKAASFSDGYVTSQELFTNPTTFSTESWFNTTSTGARIIGFGNTAEGRSTNYDKHVYLDTSGRVVFGIWNGQEYTITTDKSFNDGAWHQVVATFGSAGMALYVDGELIGTNAHNVSDAYDGYWRVGTDNTWSGSGAFSGQIDEAAIYDHVLSAATVRSHYRASGVFENQPPVSTFSLAKNGLSVSADASASHDPDGSVAAYAWDFGDGHTATTVSPTHTYTGAGTYVVSLTVTDDLGSSVTTTRSIGVRAASAAPSDEYGQAVTADSPQLFWRFDEGQGSTAHDTTRNVYDGTAAGATFGAASAVTVGGHALTLDGDQYVASNEMFDGPTTFSVESWFKTTGTGQRIIGFGNSNTGTSTVTDRMVFVDESGRVAFGADATTKHTITSPNSYNDGQWHYVVATLGAEGMSLYVDGALQASSTDAVTDPYSGYWRVGSDSSWAGNGQFSGEIDETAVYAEVLSAERVAAHYAASVAHNAAPVADFESTCTGGACSFTSTASDPDGTVDNLSWDFGDGSSPANGASVSHEYAAGGTFQVTLTVTDNRGVSTTVEKNVEVTLPNKAPVAAIDDPSIDGLTVDVDGSSSADEDGSIADYTWNFGDDTPEVSGDDATVSHTYAEGGTYTVTLTVTDNKGATNAASVSVTVAAPNKKPTAVIDEPATNQNSVQVDGSNSTDVDGSIVSYSWSFGDGGTATGATAEHSYTAGGTYTVTLVVTDNEGATDSVTRQVTVDAPAVTVVAKDSFNRTGSRWGTADIGGSWTDSGASFFATDGSMGQVSVARAGSGPVATLEGVSTKDVTIVTDFSLAQRAAGGAYMHGVKARINGTSYYMLTARMETNGSVRLYISRVAAGVETQLKSVTVAGLTYSGGDRLRIRFDVHGDSPTQLEGKVWATSGTEPAAANVTATDSTASLQTAGAIGLRFYTSGSTTSLPTQVSVDDFQAQPYTDGALENQAPVAKFAAESNSWNLSVDAGASTDDGSITSYAWDFGDGATGNGKTATHTYDRDGSFVVKLTVTDDRGVTSTSTKTVEVANAAPLAKFSSETQEWTLSVDASESSDDGEIASYAWTFGDGATATGRTATHAYSDDGDYLVTLTVTDEFGVATTVEKTVTVVNHAPVAKFAASTDGLKVSLDAGESSDDVKVETYTWDIDGESATGKTVSHTFDEPGDYQVTLTVADGRGLTNSITKTVTVTENAAPSAAFEADTSDLTVSLDASGSQDDAPGLSYAWEFGDGHDGAGRTVTHTYSEAGTYTVKLTVTDAQGLKDSTTKSVSVTAPAVPKAASDSFDRTETNGWGQAEEGGQWTTNANSMFSADGDHGVISIPGAGRGPLARLADVQVRDVSIVTDFALNKTPAGGAYSHQVLARVDGTSSYYMAAVRVNTNGSVQLYLSKVVNGTETVLRSTTLATFGLTANQSVMVRLDVTGTGTSQLAAKVWKSGEAEPSDAQVTTTDSTSSLQGAGAVGLKAYTGGAMTNTPIVVTVGSFEAEEV